jgi:hypothetical protein
MRWAGREKSPPIIRLHIARSLLVYAIYAVACSRGAAAPSMLMAPW